MIVPTASIRSPRPTEAGGRAPARAARSGGFTLLEVVIAAALTATLFLVLAQVLVKGVRTYDQQEVRAELYQTGRVALDRISRDLRAGGDPVVTSGSVTFPFDSDGDDVLDAVRRYEQDGDRLVRITDADPPEIIADKVDSVLFSGEDLTTVSIVMKDGAERVELRTGVRHAN